MKNSERILGSISSISKAAVYKLALVVMLLCSLFVAQDVSATTSNKLEQITEHLPAPAADILNKNLQQTVFHCNVLEARCEESSTASLTSTVCVIDDDVNGEAPTSALCGIIYDPNETGGKGGQLVPPSKDF